MKKYLFLVIAMLAILHVNAQNEPQKGIKITGFQNIKKQETPTTLYIIDGVLSTKEAWDRIPKEKLESLNIYKNVQQVYVVQTQAPENQVRVVNYREVTAKPTNNPKYLGTLTSVPDSAIKIFGPDAFIVRKNNPTPPLWLVKKGEDKYQVIKEKEVQAMDRELIKGLMILKDRTAEPYKKYGDTSNGVVILVLRESKKK